MGRKNTKITIKQLSNIDYDDIVNKYIEMLPDYKAKPSISIVYPKFLFLIHLIIMRCQKSKDNQIQLNSDRLQDVLGNEYNYMLYCLRDLRIINISEHYLVNEKCRFISLINWNISVTVATNFKVINYIERWKKLSKKASEKYENDNIKVVVIDGKIQLIKAEPKSLSAKEQEFITRYEEALSFLDFKCTRADAVEYVNSLFKDYNNHTYHYYTYCIENFNKSNNKIYSIDDQYRIYHCLTSLPSRLKRLFNIKYQLDIANCHPLLFSMYLIKKYKISNEILSIIYNINKEEYNKNPHNVTELFCNMLIDYKLDVPIDIISYIYVCSKGLLWDNFSAISGFSRDKVKVKAFQEIFYPQRDFSRHTEFGSRFIHLYPNVYQAIKEIKNIQKLPNLLMRYESILIRSVLNECYNRGWKVVNIHDAIIVLDTETNNSVREIDVKYIINDVFRKYLLHPTIHCDAPQ